MLTDHVPRLSLAFLPTPLEEMPRLRAALGTDCPRLLVKRDDQTGLATGGNKTRKLEFSLADARQQNADVVITAGAAQSNHCRQTAAACAKLGLRCVLVLSGAERPKEEFTGNLLLDDLFGAEIVWTGVNSGKTPAAGDRRVQVMAETAERLRADGHSPYLIPIGASNVVGALGYVAAVEELHTQLQERGEHVDRITFVSNSGGTHAGILVGALALGMSAQVEGLMNEPGGRTAEYVLDIAQQTVIRLGLDLTITPADVQLHLACGTHGYGIITDAEREAMRLIARTEGIITDPVYAGRGLGGLIERIRAGVYRRDETVLFWHTGGTSGLFPVQWKSWERRKVAEKRIYVAYTGGTIGMKHTESGYAPEAGYLTTQIGSMPEFQNPSVPAFDLHEYNPLLDSANMTHHNWREIAEDIASHYDSYAGFIVLHGTDTMAYTASALPFMLSGLQKPVILTGSQIPLCEVRSDARENLITALMIAARYPIPEVCLYFGSTLLRGCRATKVSSGGFDAFASPNYPPLGTAGVDIDIDWDHVLSLDRSVRNRLTLQPLDTSAVSVLRLFPGISADMVRNMLQPPLKGLIIEAYGVGNGPEKSRDLMNALAEASERGVVIVVCSQCLYGTVDLEDYAAGSALARAGAISGYDMTTETALAKLRYLFSLNLSSEDIKAVMQTNLVGELTRPDDA